MNLLDGHYLVVFLSDASTIVYEFNAKFRWSEIKTFPFVDTLADIPESDRTATPSIVAASVFTHHKQKVVFSFFSLVIFCAS